VCARELGDAASVPERLALDEANKVLIVAEKVDESADVRLDEVSWPRAIACASTASYRASLLRKK
jgi:hypothetical protein